MAFVAEDGTGLSNANSFASVQGYRDYWAERGVDVRCQTDAQVKTYLIRATDHIEKNFGSRYRGVRATLTQSLGFPRSGIVVDGVTLASDAVPVNLLRATFEYGYRASKYADLVPDAPLAFERKDASGETISGTGAVVSTREKVGPIEEEVHYVDPATLSASWSMPSYPEADRLLDSLINGTGGRTLRA